MDLFAASQYVLWIIKKSEEIELPQVNQTIVINTYHELKWGSSKITEIILRSHSLGFPEYIIQRNQKFRHSNRSATFIEFDLNLFCFVCLFFFSKIRYHKKPLWFPIFDLFDRFDWNSCFKIVTLKLCCYYAFINKYISARFPNAL